MISVFFIFGAIGSDGQDVFGEALSGVQNAGWIWVPLLTISAIAAFFLE